MASPRSQRRDRRFLVHAQLWQRQKESIPLHHGIARELSVAQRVEKSSFERRAGHFDYRIRLFSSAPRQNE